METNKKLDKGLIPTDNQFKSGFYILRKDSTCPVLKQLRHELGISRDS